MGLKVIGAGFGRTGTASLKLALERTGFGPCYHMSEAVAAPGHFELWSAAADRVDAGRAPDWEKIFDGWRSAVDFPAARYWRELADIYPDAKVILTTRDPEHWYQSTQETIFAPEMWARMAPTPFGAMAKKVINAYFDHQIHDREIMLRVFGEHEAAVKAAIPAERLLIFEAKDGWAPLCAFLDVPIPDEPYPRVNSKAELQAFNAQLDTQAGRTMFDGKGLSKDLRADLRARVFGKNDG